MPISKSSKTLIPCSTFLFPRSRPYRAEVTRGPSVAGWRTWLLACVLLWLQTINPALAQAAFDLTVTKTGPVSAAVDTDVAYTIVVTNLGPDPAANVAIDDPLPFGMTFVSAAQNSGPAFSCITPGVGGAGTISCTIATLPSGASASFTFTAHIPSGTPANTDFVNIVTVSPTQVEQGEINPENNSAVWLTSGLTSANADLALTKSGPTEAAPGANITYTLSLANNGPAAADSVVLIDSLPANATFVSLAAPLQFACSAPNVGDSGGSISCSLASFANGSTATFTVVLAVPPATPVGTTLFNTATVGSGNDPSDENNTASVTTTTASTDLSVLASGPAAVNAGAPLAYTLTVTNLGPDFTIGRTTVANTLPVGATGAAGSGAGWGCTAPAGGVITCTSDATVASGASFPALTIAMTAPAAPGNVQDSATVSSGTDPNPGNNTSASSTNVIAQSNLSITKTAAAIAVSGGGITYTIVVTNAGPSAATGVSVSDPTPAGLSFVSNSGACSTPFPCNLGTLNAGQSATISATFSINAGFIGNLQNTATVSAATADPDNANNAATASTNIVAPPPPQTIPTLGEMGLLLVAMLLTLSGAIWQRRRNP